MTKFIPLYDRILVKREAEETVSKGGIFIPDSAKDKPAQGIVISVGKGLRENGVLMPLSVEEGDAILFGKYAGTEIKLNGEDFLIMREDEVLGQVVSQEKKAKRGK